jgi:hypothetical protein
MLWKITVWPTTAPPTVRPPCGQAWAGRRFRLMENGFFSRQITCGQSCRSSLSRSDQAGGVLVLVKTAARDAYPSKSSRDVGDRNIPADIFTDLGQDQFAGSRQDCRAVKINELGHFMIRA